MLPDGTIVTKSKGLPSGSMYTQLVGSLINLLVIRTLFKIMNIPIKWLRVLGDDSHTIVNKHMYEKYFSMEKVIEFSKLYFNLTINEEKVIVCKSTKELTFLGYKSNGYRYVLDKTKLFS
jgi:hypothetical protein